MKNIRQKDILHEETLQMRYILHNKKSCSRKTDNACRKCVLGEREEPSRGSSSSSRSHRAAWSSAGLQGGQTNTLRCYCVSSRKELQSQPIAVLEVWDVARGAFVERIRLRLSEPQGGERTERLVIECGMCRHSGCKGGQREKQTGR